MNILMMTNTYTPLVGGLERSVRDFTQVYRRRGHRVVVVAPVYPGMPRRELDVIRIPAIQHFNGSDFSIKLPIPPLLTRALLKFHPHLIHAHHPFLMGATALRLARRLKIPLVFTHHTLFEQYTHYLPIDSPASERFMIRLSTGYANLCDRVFAPSESVAALLRERGVRTTIDVVPTGIDIRQFARGRGAACREHLRIPAQAFVVGHVGRLAPEKNPEFLAKAVARFLAGHAATHFLLVGHGPSEAAIRRLCAARGVANRLHAAGVLRGRALVQAYHAMNVFVFASKSETQGLVVTEAMAAGTPVVALDASGVREAVADRRNGRLLRTESTAAFAEAIAWMAALSPARRRAMQRAARATAATFAMERCAERALERYLAVLLQGFDQALTDDTRWASALRRLKTEWRILANVARATGAAMSTAAGTRAPAP